MLNFQQNIIFLLKSSEIQYLEVFAIITSRCYKYAFLIVERLNFACQFTKLQLPAYAGHLRLVPNCGRRLRGMSRVGALPRITDITVLLIITCGIEYTLFIDRNNASAVTSTFANKP